MNTVYNITGSLGKIFPDYFIGMRESFGILAA